VDQGDTVRLGDCTAQVINVGGHTLGHVAYHLPEAGIAFVGDALFALGCGRMFEGTAPQFWASLQRLKALPAQTTLYCAHEYTAANARFALHADPDNQALAAYAARWRPSAPQAAPPCPSRWRANWPPTLPARRRSGHPGPLGRRCGGRLCRIARGQKPVLSHKIHIVAARQLDRAAPGGQG
jgi:glyoxylase-like metal-dependent hydrolase (beta-lactamase superfamily II)